MIGALILIGCGLAVVAAVPFAGMLADGVIGLARLFQRWRAR
jgi:hypothetical protein